MSGWQPTPATALLILADGTRLEGRGIGAVGHAAGEVCFNTAMTGYQEILTDPSYAGQIVTFTFPHIGNVGTNDEDLMRAYSYPIGSYFVSLDARGLPAVFCRDLTMTVRQLVEQFGVVPGTRDIDWRRFSQTVKDAWTQSHYEQA